jgi:hypothetical protein
MGNPATSSRGGKIRLPFLDIRVLPRCVPGASYVAEAVAQVNEMKHFYPELALLASILLCLPAQPQQPPATNQSFGSTVQAGTQPSVPQTSNGSANTTDPDPLLDPPPLPNGKVTLVGGTVKSVDMVRNHLVVQPFGGGAMKVNFDERTHIYRDGIETTQLGIRKGERVYIDTMLDGSAVFARNIRVRLGQPAHAEGQVISFDPQSGMLVLRDRLSSQPLSFRASQNTAVTVDGKRGSLADLKPGSIISVRFSPYRANSGSATEIAISAVPGTVFTFSGKVTNVDLRNGVISVENRTDDKTYDINFNIGRVDRRDALNIGSDVTIQAVFQSTGYLAQSVTVDQPPAR